MNKRLTFKQLVTIFFVTLLFFTWLRFDFEQLVDSKVRAAIEQSGMVIEYGKLDFSGLSVVVKDVILPATDKVKMITVDQITLSPAWLQMFSGHLALSVDLVWQGSPLSFWLYQDDGRIHLQDIMAKLDVNKLASAGLQIPVSVQGFIDVQGEGITLLANGQAESGNLSVMWQDAAVAMGSSVYSLGEIVCALDGAESVWNWNIQGAKLGLIGEGKVQVKGDIRSSIVSGSIRVHPLEKNVPEIAKMMRTMLGKNQLSLQLSGSLASPNIQM